MTHRAATTGINPVQASFIDRHMGLSAPDRERAMASLGLASTDSIIAAALPATLRQAPPSLAPALSEAEVAVALTELANRNQQLVAMIGLGYYACHIPAVLQRGILENPGWYTAYTPYQPEISQGRLEALLTFQTMIADLTGLPIANASLLDEPTAVVEAMTLMVRQARGRSRRVAIDGQLFPQTLALLETRAAPLDIELVAIDPVDDPLPSDLAGVIVQYQGARGRLLDLAPIAAAAQASSALLAVAADPLALTLLRAPGDVGADIVVGSTGRFGMPLGFGGPHAAYMAVRAGLERQMPGRLVGISRDAVGDPALRLALQTREQHIRREKATSNICTAQVLPAVMAAMFTAWHGPEGLTSIAQQIQAQVVTLAAALRAAGLSVSGLGFDTLYVVVPGQAANIKARGRRHGVALWADAANGIGISLDQTTTTKDLVAVAAAFGISLTTGQLEVTLADRDQSASAITPQMRRDTPFLTHQVFHDYRSETAMMRYLHRLANRDYALNRGMIPLGSCTMKLNPAAAMAPLTWPGFGNVHPFVDAPDAAGYLEVIEDLEQWLAEITGYDAVSLQPNAGSQGELAGLLAIRRYHQSQGQTERRICLIPNSAHGTNAASAALAGLGVVNLATQSDGAIDQADLAAKIAAHPGQIAAIMLTYPSTYGVYESNLREVCAAVHAAGGQVYIDGANFNAMVGWAAAGQLGGDVSHLNLHKTFGLPHGGGGPGVGPVAAKAHLADYLPGHPLAPQGAGTDPVAGAPYGSALLLPLAWAYLRLTGAQGLVASSQAAVLAANYVAHQLEDCYPVLYRGQDDWVAHECILDLRPLTARTGMSVDDVAKRLMDYGFHAPTMSFPVAGTLMVEPTESESLAELDRFCDAMQAIAGEAESWAAVDPTDNPLKGAPHTAICAIADPWDHPYSRAQAVYPTGPDRDKYWPPVRRVDGAWGDRHLTPTWPT